MPPLLIGEDRAEIHTSARSLSDRVQGLFPGLNAYEPIGSRRTFKAKSFAIVFPTLKLVASAISPSYVDRNGKQDMTLLIPLAGQCSVTINNTRFAWGVGSAGVFLPEFTGRIVGEGGYRCLVMMHLNRDTLEMTARAMLGLCPDEPLNLRLDEPRLTPVTFAGQNVALILQKLGALMELYQYDPKILSQLRFDDVLYRHVIGLICPELNVLDPPKQQLNRPGTCRHL